MPRATKDAVSIAEFKSIREDAIKIKRMEIEIERKVNSVSFECDKILVGLAKQMPMGRVASTMMDVGPVILTALCDAYGEDVAERILVLLNEVKKAMYPVKTLLRKSKIKLPEDLYGQIGREARTAVLMTFYPHVGTPKLTMVGEAALMAWTEITEGNGGTGAVWGEIRRRAERPDALRRAGIAVTEETEVQLIP